MNLLLWVTAVIGAVGGITAVVYAVRIELAWRDIRQQARCMEAGMYIHPAHWEG